MSAQVWSWVLTAVGLTGFFLAGNKVWWAWYVNLANQLIWIPYSIITHQWGFLVGALCYTVFFTRNSIKWTKEHLHGAPTERTDIRIGEIESMSFGPNGVTVVSKMDDTVAGHKAWQAIFGSKPE